VSGADNDRIPGDDGSGVETDLAGYEIDLLIVIELQIDNAILPKGGHAVAGFGVERDEAIAGSDVEDALFAAISPISEAAAGKLARGVGPAGAFFFAVCPQQFAGSGIDGSDGAAGAGGGVDDPVGFERRAFEIVFRAGRGYRF
jgi:hypothetical protein